MKKWHKKLGILISCFFILINLNSFSLAKGKKKKSPTKKLWEFDVENGVINQPVFDHRGNIFLSVDSGLDGKLISLSKHGKKRWEFATKGRLLAPPAIGKKNQLYIGDAGDYSFSSPEKSGNSIYALKKGKLQWTFTVGGNIKTAPLYLSPDLVVVGAIDGYLYALTPGNCLKGDKNHSAGTYIEQETKFGYDRKKIDDPHKCLKWQLNLNGKITTLKKAVDNSVIYALESETNSVYAINLEGKKLWQFSLPGSHIYHIANGCDHSVYLAAGKLIAIDGKGKKLWEWAAADVELAGISQPLTVDSKGNVLVGFEDYSLDSTSYYLYAIGSKGKLSWSHKVTGKIKYNSAVDTAGNTIVGTKKNMLFATDHRGNGLWQVELNNEPIGKPVLTSRGKMLITLYNHKVIMFKSNLKKPDICKSPGKKK